MITNKIIHLLIVISSIIVVPIQGITTLVLGILVSLTFGLLLLPISFVWAVFFLGPLLGLSYIYERVTFLRPFISVLGIPLAVLGNAYVAMMPSMGEMEGRFEKLVICETFPFTWKYLQLINGKTNLTNNDTLTRVLREVSKAKPLSRYLDQLRADVISRPESLKSSYKLDW